MIRFTYKKQIIGRINNILANLPNGFEILTNILIIIFQSLSIYLKISHRFPESKEKVNVHGFFYLLIDKTDK